MGLLPQNFSHFFSTVRSWTFEISIISFKDWKNIFRLKFAILISHVGNSVFTIQLKSDFRHCRQDTESHSICIAAEQAYFASKFRMLGRCKCKVFTTMMRRGGAFFEPAGIIGVCAMN